MKVYDAGVIVELLVADVDPAAVGDDPPAVPHLIDSEVTNVLSTLARRAILTDAQATTTMDGFLALSFDRFPAEGLRPRIWSLRHNLSAYDATYVALAESIDATLITTDARLARAPGPRCAIEHLPAHTAHA
ncbi:type II toxin-antitoxin system VapC family toxin [Tomitella cavernea]|uniref:Ribonuclease VapC n=1 Tax=Tomitella cavernea TaxID=1387982 RepID=A0ABP9CWT0_9ACTN|nr:type II toxin-antitoxin system VapC family toxin [Tomitella cavernea]